MKYKATFFILFYFFYSYTFAQINSCSTQLTQKTNQTWTQFISPFIQQQLDQRLIQKKDVYVLYDVQTYLHNFIQRSRICKNYAPYSELGKILAKTYTTLENEKWICRGGAICTETNKLINTEIQLVSLQYLGFISTTINGIADSSLFTQDSELDQFVELSLRTILSHLKRWTTDPNSEISNNKLQALMLIPALLVNEKSGSKYFFSDKHLWALIIHQELSGLFKHSQLLKYKSDYLKSGLNKNYEYLLNLFISRTSKEKTGSLSTFDIDRGYWRYYPDNRYAQYTKAAKPVECQLNPNGSFTKIVNVKKDLIPLDEIAGWDISHARRLSHFILSIDYNLNDIYTLHNNLKNNITSIQDTKELLINTLTQSLWNQNPKKILFSNFLNGKNGWYRVGYDNGTHNCVEGTPPYGLSFSIPTGGYFLLNGVNKRWDQIKKSFNYILNSKSAEDIQFIQTNYPLLDLTKTNNSSSINQFMYYSSIYSD